MSDYKTLVRSIYEDIFNNGDHTKISTLYAEDVVAHDPSYGPMKGTDKLRTLLEGYREAMPDHKYEVIDIISEGDKVAVHWRVRGKFTGNLMGQKATHKNMDVTGLSFMRIADDKVVEIWQHWDERGFYNQLDLPLPARS